MIKSILLVLFIICIVNGSLAQHSKTVNNSSTEKKSAVITPVPATGFKKRVSLAKPPVLKNTNATATPGHINAINPPDAARISEIIRIDYNNMPSDVKTRIDANKAAGKNLVDGISKVFTVEIDNCTTDADHKRILSFLKNRKGFINSEFVAAGRVRIIVEPAFDSVDLKEAMAAEGIRFNFLNRSYLLKR